MPDTLERLHEVPGACDRLGIRKSKLYELIAAGEIRTVKIGRRRLVPESSILAFIAGLA